MSTLNIPVTATNMVEWVRRCATAVNELIRRLGLLTTRVDTAETNITGLDTRATALEAFAASPFTVDSITFNPIALPGSPTEGLTVLDVADDIVKTYAGGSWHSHY